MEALFRLFAWMRHPYWTVREFWNDPFGAWRTARMVLACFWVTIGTSIRVMPRCILNTLTGRRGENLAFIYAAARQWAHTIFRHTGVHIEVYGKERIDWSKPYVIVANHQSTLDIVAIPYALSSPARIVAKRRIRWYPFFGQAVWLSDACIFIDRTSRAQSMGAIRNTVTRAPDESIFFFAEGHRCASLGPFKMGAFRTAHDTGLPILPIVFSGGADLLQKGSLLRFRSNRTLTVIVCPAIRDTDGVDSEKLLAHTRRVINGNLEPQYRDPSLACLEG
ncbi:MAG: 1-acyl-sn-glycerol-3-phosphate acyltransferase [Parcubacteria group bacterium]|nr:1-acyl-sn-glycerol-3-phosphate acyltransferase [Parcubacteria group bacterium]